MNQGNNKRRQGAKTAMAITAAALLAGCTATDAAPAATGSPAAGPSESSATPAASATPTPTADPAALITLALPTPGPTPAEQVSFGKRDNEADKAYMEEFLAQAWDTMYPKSLSEVSIGDCLFFDYDYAAKTTALFTVDCSQPHEGEVLGIYQHPQSEYPGQSGLMKATGQAFGEAADRLRESGQVPASASYKDLPPTEADWEAGERTSLTILRHGGSYALLEDSYLDPRYVTTTGSAN